MSDPKFAALGVWAGPAGALVLPPGTGHAARVARGDVSDMPASWRFLTLAAEGDLAMAARELPDGDAPELRLNRWILTGFPEPSGLDDELSAIYGCAAFQAGETDTLPDVNPAWNARVQAYAHATRAWAQREGGQAREALAELDAALRALQTVDAPIFRARMHAERAAMLPPEQGLADVRAAVRDAAEHPDPAYRAELALQHAMTAQAAAAGRRDLLLEAVNAYQAALGAYKKSSHPQEYALAQMNLGLAYLDMPMNDDAARVRPAVALSCLREARGALSAQQYPQEWAAASVNLANALVYAPSTHREDNLWEAVALYEETLTLPRDDLSRARTLANQGNALAHLGAFSRAVPRLTQARDLFAQHGETEAAGSVQAVLDDIASRSEAQP